MKKLYLVQAVALLGIAVLTMVSCKKDSKSTFVTGSTTMQSVSEQTSVKLATSAAVSQAMFGDVFKVVLLGTQQSGLKLFSVKSANNKQFKTLTSAPQPVITVSPADSTTYPKTITINFGSGVTTDSVTHAGEIVVTLSGKVTDPSTLITISYDGYSVNGYNLKGTYSIVPSMTATGVNYAVTVADGSITFPSGEVNNFSLKALITQTGGLMSSSFYDDTYTITGDGVYSNSNGTSITGSITTPLVKSFDCNSISSGIISFVYNGINGTADFGSGTCDNQITVTSGNTTKVLSLPL